MMNFKIEKQLIMPNTYEEIDEIEMEYIDGGQYFTENQVSLLVKASSENILKLTLLVSVYSLKTCSFFDSTIRALVNKQPLLVANGFLKAYGLKSGLSIVNVNGQLVIKPGNTTIIAPIKSVV